MTSATLVAPLLVALVLIVSGIAKVRDRGSVDEAFATLDVPDGLNKPWIRRCYPWFEIVVGALLIVCPWPGNIFVAFIALLMTCAYIYLVWGAYRRPEPVDCHCFGSMASGRVTWLTLARNITLGVLALVAVFDAFSGAPMVRLYTTDALGWILGFIVTVWLAYTIFGDRVRTLSENPTQDAASAAQGVDGHDAAKSADDEDDLADYRRLPIPFGTLEDHGEQVTLRELARHRAVLLVWVSTTCGACAQIIPEIPGWRETFGELVDVRPVFSGSSALDEADVAPMKDYVLIDPNSQTERLFDLFGVPAAVLMGADGELAGGPVTGGTDIQQLVADMKLQLDGVERPAQAETVPDAPASDPVKDAATADPVKDAPAQPGSDAAPATTVAHEFLNDPSTIVVGMEPVEQDAAGDFGLDADASRDADTSADQSSVHDSSAEGQGEARL